MSRTMIFRTTMFRMMEGPALRTAGALRSAALPLAAWMASARAALSYLPQRVAVPEALTGGAVVDF